MSEEVYCIDCGEDEKLAYLRTCASGDLWRCKTCGKEFEFTIKEV